MRIVCLLHIPQYSLFLEMSAYEMTILWIQYSWSKPTYQPVRLLHPVLCLGSLLHRSRPLGPGSDLRSCNLLPLQLPNPGGYTQAGGHRAQRLPGAHLLPQVPPQQRAGHHGDDLKQGLPVSNGSAPAPLAPPASTGATEENQGQEEWRRFIK